MESHSVMILTEENRRTGRKTCPSATSSTTDPTWKNVGMILGIHGDRLVTNRLRHRKTEDMLRIYLFRLLFIYVIELRSKFHAVYEHSWSIRNGNFATS
jgi:hypothetical protein